MKKAVFLDRDGVINKSLLLDSKPIAPKSLDDLVILSKVDSALEILKELGFMLVVVTNQPDVVRGKQTKENVIKINEYLAEQLPLNKFYVCYHDDHDNCACRKPKAGMLYTAAEALDIDLENSYMIGDRWRDISAGYYIDFAVQKRSFFFMKMYLCVYLFLKNTDSVRK
ncbi:MAG: HAD-IIIA family hydrolase [Legionellales bacterium]|nr:HAD-IIIA family hydrolase [Legionellales bacterium]